MTKKEWLEVYEKKIGLKYTPAEHELTAFDPERGICSFIDQAYLEPGVFEVRLIVGDAGYWMRLIKQAMLATGCTKARYITRRNPRAMTRKFGARIKAYIMEVDIDDAKIWSQEV